MNYYNEIKMQIINNEIKRKARNYIQNKNDLETYYNIGKLLSEAGKHYGEGIIKEYSKKLTDELSKKYSTTSLRYMRLFYNFSKCHSVSDKLTYTHYKKLLSISDDDKINYYIDECIKNNLSVRQLEQRIKSNEYERLPNETKIKLKENNKLEVNDLIKNPIILNNKK